MMPSLAILQHELRSLLASWLVRSWLAASVVLTLLILAANWGSMPTAPLIASLLFPYLVFPWFLVVMLLGIGPVTGTRLDALADGILSRPVTRHEYLLAAWCARVLTVLGAFFIVIVPVVALVVAAKRPVPEDHVTSYGVIACLVVVELVLTFLVSLGFLMGTLLRRPLLAAVVLIFCWMPANLVLHTLSVEEFSPISLNQALPTLLRTPWRTTAEQQAAGASQEDLEALAKQAATFMSILSGQQAQATPRREGFYERGDYEDFSLVRVLLGYCVPTLAAVALATFCFYRRDL